jgi:hypothetical protein
MMEMSVSCGYCKSTVATVLLYKPEDILKLKDVICNDCQNKGVRMDNYDRDLDTLK